MKFDKVIAKKMREEIEAALKVVADKYDVSIRTGSCTYSETDIKYRLEVKTNDKSVIEEKEKRTWESYCHLFDFKKDDYKRIFESQGESYTIIGLDLGKSKYSLKCRKVSDGKIYGFVAEQIAKKINGNSTKVTSLV